MIIYIYIYIYYLYTYHIYNIFPCISPLLYTSGILNFAVITEHAWSPGLLWCVLVLVGSPAWCAPSLVLHFKAETPWNWSGQSFFCCCHCWHWPNSRRGWEVAASLAPTVRCCSYMLITWKLMCVISHVFKFKCNWLHSMEATWQI